MRRICLAGVLSLLLICTLVACDAQGGLIGILGGLQPDNESDGNGNYLENGENGTLILDEFGFAVGDGNYVIIGGQGEGGPSYTITVVDPLSQIGKFDASMFEETEKVTDYVKITVRDYGEIVVMLCKNQAPLTVANFQNLVAQGFYDGLVFHRVIQNFMIQGGGFDQEGVQKQAGTVKGEFEQNGHKNGLNHVRGVISMARMNGNMDSATSQFFICDADSPHLNGAYASFGVVLAGMETVDAIAAVETDGNDHPVSDVVIESITFVTPNAHVKKEK